ncbi:MAG TPA: hypothetical protein VMF08_09800 [Candidatus Sulfotelmatobacter sp.]|nr:hypothetical protein [Candidatus Sulfotelmatobacter sp.]
MNFSLFLVAVRKVFFLIFKMAPWRAIASERRRLMALATSLQLSPRSRLMGGQFAEMPSKTHVFRISFPPMTLASLPFSVIWGIFGDKTAFKTHFFDHRKGQFLL